MSDPLPFATLDVWMAWLSANPEAPEVWVLYHKKATGVPSIDWETAVIGALANGWIDGIRKSVDATRFMQRFTPRRPKSVWSARNVAHCERLIAEGKMTPRGLAQVQAAQADGRWEQAYRTTDALPEDFLAAVAASPKAAEALKTLDARNRFAIVYRLNAVKRPETRARKVAEFIAMLERGERLHGS
ncbi:YdeI/OmpD-associated family protein [Stagnihabitans tardus]|uniref:Bacteriocin-protection protein n=1 Tax=Stagnihabitans tardus TaxID=2699202 RepID=A0AAE4YB06_9RHOB|nr:YdeI/OmpD-associated family protein [Stagnihabitans tardus]NBZ86635.1 hypothetical protein [Stagnihabitans tardus]